MEAVGLRPLVVSEQLRERVKFAAHFGVYAIQEFAFSRLELNIDKHNDREWLHQIENQADLVIRTAFELKAAKTEIIRPEPLTTQEFAERFRQQYEQREADRFSGVNAFLARAKEQRRKATLRERMALAAVRNGFLD